MLEETRIKANLTKRDMAFLMGVTIGAYSHWITGIRPMSGQAQATLSFIQFLLHWNLLGEYMYQKKMSLNVNVRP